MLLLTSVAWGCVGSQEREAAGAKQEPARPARSSAQEPPPAEAVAEPPPKPEFVKAEAGDVAEVVRAQLSDASDCEVLIYVGATWCEPCQRFHEAVEKGKLDDKLAGVRFVEFDHDVDKGRLVDAGYGGAMIPRFVVPNDDGTGSDQRIEGGVKGEAAVDNIMGRLEPLLGKRG